MVPGSGCWYWLVLELGCWLASWFPFWGGSEFTFFDPVFNFADSCVTVGIISLLLFCRKELEALGKKEEVTDKKEETSDKNKENLDTKNEEEKA